MNEVLLLLLLGTTESEQGRAGADFQAGRDFFSLQRDQRGVKLHALPHQQAPRCIERQFIRLRKQYMKR